MLVVSSFWKVRIRSIFMLLAIACVTLPVFSATIEARFPVVRGWHEWYSLKADPEDVRTLMVCGAGWDSLRNALYGFVAVSRDGGKSWRSTLEDRDTTWVSEESCAFGPNHMAYFVSEASLVIDGIAHHDRGTTHLFVSNDAGEHWTKSIDTAWTDYSTSAVSSSSGELVTFYNSGTSEPGRGWGTTIGALIFSRDGKQVRGSYFDPRMRQEKYIGNLPSQAIGIDDGSVVALSGAPRLTKEGYEYDLGLQRVEPGQSDPVHYTKIISMKPACFAMDGHTLAYDKKNKQLILAYSSEAAQGCGITIATSSDLGKTWIRQSLGIGPLSSHHPFDHLALALSASGTAGLLWEDSGKWFFCTIKESRLSGPPLELSAGPVPALPDNDSLMTSVFQGPEFQVMDSRPRAVISVRSHPAGVMRSEALVAIGDAFEAVIPVVRDGHEGLDAVRISEGVAVSSARSSDIADKSDRDVTSDIVLLWGNTQSFDTTTGTLNIDLRLANRGRRPIRAPILLQARELSSEAGSVAIINADNGLSGPGAVWDISRSIAGDELLPGGSSYSSFRLAFHIDLKQDAVPTYHFLDLGVAVVASDDTKVTRRTNDSKSYK